MAEEIKMPQLSDTMDEGTILTWLKNVGDSVERGDALAEVATDKADLEIESFHQGTLLKIHSPAGTTVKVGEIIAVVGAQGEEVADAAPQAAPAQAAAPAAPATSPAPAAPAAVVAPAPVNGQHADDRIKISPLAKNLAQAHGVDYQSLSGTGEGGRIVKKDIEAKLGTSFSPDAIAQTIESGQPVASAPTSAPAQAAPLQSAPAPIPQAPAQPMPAAAPVQTQAPLRASTEELSRMRATIASRMVESATTIPHFYVTTKIEVDALADMRQSLKSLPSYEGVTFNHMVLKGVALALRAHPRVNASFQNGALVQSGQINIGIITALPDGLLIPIVKSADSLSLADIVLEANGLVQRARAGRPKSEDLSGGTFSISNIGRLDVDNFTAIINPGQGGILAVAGIQEEPVVRDGELKVGKVMRVTLSVDHRIIDGVVAGEFVTELKRLIEDPVLLLA